MSFSDPIVGGGNQLLIDNVESPGYTPHVAGWTINKDGTAEFDNIEIRGGVLLDKSGDGGETQPNLIWKDGYAYQGRIFEGLGGALLIRSPATTTVNDAPSVQMDPYDPGAGSTGDITLQSGKLGVGSALTLSSENIFLNPGNGTAVIDRVHFQNSISVESAPAGHNYYEEWTFDGTLLIPSSSTLAVPASVAKPMSNRICQNDYNVTPGVTAMNLTSADWTCPGDGRYHFTLSTAFTPWVANSRDIMFVTLNGVVTANCFIHVDQNSTTGHETRHAIQYMHAGDVVNFRVAQVSGANASLTTDRRSYIGIGRES